MTGSTWKRLPLLFAVFTVAGAAPGCAEERAPINRVQADALAKSFFLGSALGEPVDDPEFYMRGTIVDVGYGAGLSGLFQSTYAQPVSRIKWEVTETLLNARLAYERIEGTDAKGAPINGLEKRVANDGQIVASFAIKEHFDIRRDYNPATGEESNIIIENKTDRVWNQREYMRVDWSRNLITTSYDFDTLSQLGVQGGVLYEPMAYYVNDPNDPDAPFFDPETGYFDVTTKVFASPAMIDISALGWGQKEIPACYLPADFAGGTAPYGNCNATEVTIRHSFKKVADTDYEQIDFDGVRFQSFGIFNFGYRYGYERNYGLLDNRWFRFASRYNLYKRSHYYDDPEAMAGAIPCATKETTEIPTGNPSADPNRDEDQNGTSDECEAAGPGSRCDIFKNKCTLPYIQREPITIPWYMGGGDPELFEATDWAVEEWDVAMKTAIQTARLVECRRTYGADCEARFPMWSGQQDDFDDAVTLAREVNRCLRENAWDMSQCSGLASQGAAAIAAERGNPSDPNAYAIGQIVAMPPVIVLCHNPVIAGDHASCGEENRKTRLGDLRWHSVLVIDKPQTPSSWGIMVDADDPISGEKVATSVNVWSHVTDIAAQSLVDVVRFANGELPASEVTDGTYVREWAQASKLSAGGGGPTMSRDEVAARLAAATKLDPSAYKSITQGSLVPEVKEEIAKLGADLADVAARADIPSPEQAAVRARMGAARGSAVEAKLMNPAMLKLAGVPGGLPLEGAVADAASPLALNNPKVQAELRRMHDEALAARGACVLHEAPEASGVPGLAEVLARKFPILPDETESAKHERHLRMFQYIRRRYQYAVVAHEMGHSIGLRHNFVSNTAALFFRPQYWQLRTRNGEVTAPCTGAPGEDPNKCVGPRYYDAITEEENDQLIWMYQHSSVMDYPGDVTQDLLGLGVYDVAAARFFYGDVVAVYNSPDERYLAGKEVGTGLLQATDSFGGLAGIKYGAKRKTGFEQFHYSALQKEYNVITQCYDVAPKPPATWDESIDGIWDPVADGKLVTIDGATKRCRQQPVDYVGWEDLRYPTEKEVGNAFYRGGPAVHDATGRVRVPYAFATDHWADTGNASVFRHDQGADPYEQVMFLVTTQENRHIFDNYRRHRTTFSVRSAAARSFERYNQKMLGIAGGIGFYGTIYQDLATNQGLSFDTLWPFIVEGSLHENVIAATVAFDHFTRQLSRPHVGPHYFRSQLFNDPVLHSDDDADDYGAGANLGGGLQNSDVMVVIPNGSTGYLKDVGFGGRPLNNAYAEDAGDFNTEYTIWAGSYYDKIHTAILLAESEDRFVSSSRRDFYDARFRAVGMADVLPEGFRRVLANALTGDRTILAPEIEAKSGLPLLDLAANNEVDPDAKKYPARPLGWKSFWPQSGPAVCFPKEGLSVCFDYLGGDFSPVTPPETVSVDPQIGWEVQKFLIAWTLAYLPSNEKSEWLDMMRVYRLGKDADPKIDDRVEWEDPQSGQVYYARTYGWECLFGSGGDRASCESSGGKWAQKGIAARVLQYASYLTSRGYKLDTSYAPNSADPAFNSGEYPPGFNRYGRPMVLHHPGGEAIIVPDPAIKDISADGTAIIPVEPCDQNIDAGCTPLSIYKNHYAYELTGYKSVPDFLQEVIIRYGLGDPEQLGVYGE
jgi:hypothetical protein